MKTFIVVLSSGLLAASAASVGEDPRVLYQDPSGRMSLTVRHDIEVQRDPPIEAHRDFSFDLVLQADSAASSVSVTIEQARGSYEAHAQKQRLGMRHLVGRTFSLSIDEDGRRLAETGPEDAAVVDLGPMVDGGYPVPLALADALPELPEGAVRVGTTWTTERPIRSLEGWNWAAGRLRSRHRVTAIDREGGRTVVRVASKAEASLGPVESGRDASGELTRTLDWAFDATAGRLLSMSLEQETTATTVVPQGTISIIQRTRVELGPAS